MSKEITLTVEIHEIEDYGTRTRSEMLEALSGANGECPYLARDIIYDWILALPPSATFRTYRKNGQFIIERTDIE
ncbi:MAG: hypothetical protein SOW36_06060 [Porphyromonas sp.]|uniref:hypothetical protein n=1 Tax=Porphyromonas sp. TaxID=1924944 RepID=UPI002A75B959|nr:hypothetical protein [Porphyromonas sp.]MDY3112182.1 hypothetical protein [Porphyromonas sp.]